MDNKKKYLMIGVIVLAVVLLISGGTYAFIVWSANETQATNVVFSVTPDYTCGADAGGHITSSDRMLAPTDCMDPEYAIQRTITTSSTTTGDKVISMDLWLNVNHIDTNLLNSPNFKYAITKNRNSCASGVINSGVIKEDIQDNKINLLEGVEYATLNDTYYLYIWLDEAETNINTMNQSFDLSIGGQCGDTGLEKVYLTDLSGTSAYFKQSEYKTKIYNVSFVRNDDVPNNAIIPAGLNKNYYDLSENQDESIKGWLIETDTDKYDLYIGSDNKIYAKTLLKFFQGMKSIENITFNNLDTSETTNMGAMFQGCNALTSLDVTSFNTSNVFGGDSGIVGMYAMFAGCKSLTSLDLSNFNTSNVTNMNMMFSGCSSLTSLDLSNFNTSNVISMNTMFNGCSSLTSLNLSNFDTSNVTKMAAMFANCPNLSSLDLSSFDTSNVTSMSQMFNGCGGSSQLNVNDDSCGNLTTIYVSNLWNIGAQTDGSWMFKGQYNLPNYNKNVFDKTNAHYGDGGYLTYKAHN